MGNYDPAGQPNQPGMPWAGAPQAGGSARPIPLSGAPQPIPLAGGGPMRPVPLVPGQAQQPLPLQPYPGQQYPAQQYPAQPTAPQTLPGAKPLPAPAGPVPVLRQESPEDGEQNPELQKVVRGAPPYLVSGIIHMTVLIVLGLWMLVVPKEKTITLEVVMSDELGEQLEAETFELVSDDALVDQQMVTPDNLMPVEDPLQAPFEVEISPLATVSSSEAIAPQIGMMLKGRTPGMRSALMRKYGGNKLTEDAVKLALAWLVRNQQRDGSWSLQGPYSSGTGVEDHVAATAMALLALQGDGHTHKTDPKKPNPFSKAVDRGWDYLLKQQGADGLFREEGGPSHHRLYAHAQATIAICELYAMSSDVKFQKPAQKAVDFCVAAQGPNGGWRYNPGQGGDMSVTGWYVMALQSAKMGYLIVPDETMNKINSFLDLMQTDGGRRYGYLGPSEVRPSMSAEGLLCRQYLGWEHDDERLQDGVAYLLQNPMDYEGQRNAYYWYYASQVLHHMEGEPWEKWNAVMKEVLPAKQIKSGGEKGSWDPDGDQWGPQGGRLYVTCLHTFMLEVYYRHLPIYKHRLGQ